MILDVTGCVPNSRLGASTHCLVILSLLLSGCLSDSGKSSDSTRKSSDSTLYPPGEPGIVRGGTQKGPFEKGSAVTIALLNASTLAIDSTISTATLDEFGQFKFRLENPQLAELSVSGFFFNELVRNYSREKITLHALCHAVPGNSRPVHVNVFTHLSAPRIRKLIAGGLPVDSARARAEAELANELGIFRPFGESVPRGIDMDLLGGNLPANIYLFGLNAILLRAAHLASVPADFEAQIQRLLDDLAGELETEGRLTPSSKTRLALAERALNFGTVQVNWRDWMKDRSLTTLAPELERVIDSDRDGTPNSSDEDDDGDKVYDIYDCAPLDSALQIENGICRPFQAPKISLISASGRIEVRWDEKAFPAEVYKLYYQASDTVVPAEASFLDSVKSGVVVTGLINGQRYSFSMFYKDKSHQLIFSRVASAVPIAIPSLVGEVQPGRIELHWDTVAGAKGYRLHYRESGVDTWVTLLNNASSPVLVREPVLKSGYRYEFALEATNTAGVSDFSKPVEFVFREIQAAVRALPDPTTASRGFQTPLAFTLSGSPCMAYLYGSGSSAAIAVVKYEGSSWADLDGGLPVPISGAGSLLGLKMDGQGKPFVLFGKDSTSVQVATREGKEWKILGDRNFGIEVPGNAWLDLDLDGHPGICFLDATQSLTAVRYNGSGWDTLGRKHFTITTHPSNFTNEGYNKKTAFRLESGMDAWVFNTTSSFTEINRFNGSEWQVTRSIVNSYDLSMSTRSAGPPILALSPHNYYRTSSILFLLADAAGWKEIGSFGQPSPASRPRDINVRSGKDGGIYLTYLYVTYGSDGSAIATARLFKAVKGIPLSEGFASTILTGADLQRATSFEISPSGTPWFTFQEAKSDGSPERRVRVIELSP